jgi:hypothetical protein
VVDDLAHVVAALDLVLDLSEDFSDLVFDGVRAAGLLFEPVQVRKELVVDEVAEVVAGQRLVVIERAVLALWRGPAFPAVRLVEDVAVLLPPSAASSARSCSSASRYFRNSSHDVCSV